MVITLSSKDNTKLLQQFKSGFKCTINWNNYQSHEINITETQNQYLNYLIDPSFHGANVPFVLPLNKQALDADPKAVQQFSWKCWASRKYSIVFILEEVKGTILNFLQGTMRVLKIYFDLI